MKFFNWIFNSWRLVNKETPRTNTPVLCYWDDFGVEVFMVCEFNENIMMFEEISTGVTQREVTHWKYLRKPF